MEEIIENITQEPSNWKKIIKFIVKMLGFIVGLSFVRFISFLLCTKYLDISDLWKILIITSIITILFMVLVDFIIKLPPTNKLKKWIKRVGKIFPYIIAFVLGRFLFELLIDYIRRILPGKTGVYLLITLGTILYIFLVLFFLLLVKWRKSKNNKIIKWIILNVVMILVLIWGWLTKSGILPNFLDLEILCPNDCGYLRCNAAEKAIYTEQFGCVCARDPSTGFMKPIIYLYPIEEMEVNVTLGTPENLSHTYPKYNSKRGWNIIAQTNGELEDMDTGRKLYALYREGKSDNATNFYEGFVVKGEDIISFLEEKLAILGLNEREAEEFIVYWLPQMEKNKYNLIRFETKTEQDENMPLNITPKPDTVIRIMMDWKAIEEPIDIPEQQLVTPERSGFTVVERGGSPRN